MKPVHPKRFYATDWAMADPACVARMERLMQGFRQPMDKIEVLTEEDIEPTIRDRDWADLDVRQGRVDFQGDPDVVFNKFRWLAPEDLTAIRECHPIFADATGYTHGMVRTLYGSPTSTISRMGTANGRFATTAAGRSTTCTPRAAASTSANTAAGAG